MPMRGPVLLSLTYWVIGSHIWPAESVTVKLSVPLDDSRTKATRRWPGLVVMGTENMLKAVPLVSMLFCTCTKASGAPVGLSPVPVRLTVCGLPLALSLTAIIAVRAPAAVGLNVTLIVQWAPAASEVGQLLP